MGSFSSTNSSGAVEFLDLSMTARSTLASQQRSRPTGGFLLAAVLLFAQVTATNDSSASESSANTYVRATSAAPSTWSSTLSGADAYAALYRPLPPPEGAGPEVLVSSGNPAEELRALTGLPVEALASVAGVTRVGYYEWLKGKPIALKREVALLSMLAVVRLAASSRGTPDDVRKWLVEPASAGGRTPLELLKAGEIEAATGFALRTPRVHQQPSRSDLAKRLVMISGLPFNAGPRVRPKSWSAGPELRYRAERVLGSGWSDQRFRVERPQAKATDHKL